MVNGWKKTHDGMESPGWYNIAYQNKKRKQEILISEEGGESDGSGDWGWGLYDDEGQPIGSQTWGFKTKHLAKRDAIRWMRKN